MKTKINNLVLLEANYLHDLLAQKTKQLENHGSSFLYAEIALLSQITEKTIPAEKFARQMIEFGEEMRTNNTYADDGGGVFHLPATEIIDDFVNNGEIIL